MRRDLKLEILSSNVVSEEFALSSLSASPLIKPFFTPSGWLEVSVCILKGFSRLVIRTDVKDRFITETFSFKNNCVEKACLVL